MTKYLLKHMSVQFDEYFTLLTDVPKGNMFVLLYGILIKIHKIDL